MSDAVHFLTNNDNNASGGAWSGCNGFPFPFGSTLTGIGTDNPVKVTFDDACKWFWRVKNWSLASTWSFTDGTTVATFPLGQLTPLSGFPTRELDLLTGAPLGWSANNANAGVTFSYYNVVFQPWVMDVPANRDSDLWPSMNPAVCGSLAIVASGTSVIFAFNPSHFTGASTGSFIASIDGYSVTVYYQVSGSGTATVGTFILTPSEFWPYAAADGSPIYDTTTGAQLQDPRN